MKKGVLKYGEYDGEQSEPIRVDRDRESQTRVKKHAEKAEKIRVSTPLGQYSILGGWIYTICDSDIVPTYSVCILYSDQH